MPAQDPYDMHYAERRQAHCLNADTGMIHTGEKSIDMFFLIRVSLHLNSESNSSFNVLFSLEIQ